MDESMEIRVAQMIKFDAEDMLPAEYRHRLREEKQPQECSLLLDGNLFDQQDSSLDANKNTSKHPQEWIKAPVFIPGQVRAPASNGFASPFEVTPPASFFHDKHFLPNFSTIPPDSMANYLTSIHPSQTRAPPSTTIILRKKRRLALPPKRLANRRFRFDCPPIELMVGKAAVEKKDFLRLESPIVQSSKNVLRSQTMWSSAMQRYSPKRNSLSPSLPDVNGQRKSTLSETDMNQLKDETIYSTTKTNGQSSDTNGGLANFDSSSCPDLSNNQLQLWDDILYSAVQQEKDMQMRKLLDDNSNIVQEDAEEDDEMDSAAFEKMTASTVMNTSVYELCPPAVFDALDVAVHADGISNKELRRLDKNMAGCSLQDSFNQNTLVDRLQQLSKDNMTIHLNPAYVSLEQTLASELLESDQQKAKIDCESDEDVLFKPQIPEQHYGYPQLSSAKVFMTTFEPKGKKITSGMDPISKCSNGIRNESVENEEMQQLDCCEGMRIQVNDFGECDDVALSEAECPSPSRFSQLQWAVQRHKNHYFETKLQNGAMGVDQPPQRVCCEIM